jgi:quinol monooxygenase YgiN
MKMTELTIVAKLAIDPVCATGLAPLFRKLIEETRKETGCILYDHHRSKADPSVYLFYETWQTRAHWQAHTKTAHIQEFQAASKGMIVGSELLEMSKFK